MIKIVLNVHKIGDAHLQCVNNSCERFEYKGMKTRNRLQITLTRNPKMLRTDGRSGPTTRNAYIVPVLQDEAGK